MNLMRLFLLFLVGLMVRRLFVSRRKDDRTGARPTAAETGRGSASGDNGTYGDLTEQGIDDADFEEIP